MAVGADSPPAPACAPAPPPPHRRALRASRAAFSPPRLPPALAGPAPLAAIKWLVKEMQVSVCGREAAAGDEGCVPVCASGRLGASASESAGAAGRCSLPLLPAPPHPAARARGAAPRPDRLASSSQSRRLLPGAAPRPPLPALPSQPSPPAPPPQPPPLARGADSLPRRRECRYFAFRIICRTQASFRSALFLLFLRPLPPEKKIPLLKQPEPQAPHYIKP